MFNKKKRTDQEIEASTGISRAKHENRNDICNELPTGKMRMSANDKMLYIDDAGRHWRRNPDIASSYHQPMSMPNAVFHTIVDTLVFCIDFPVPNMKFISVNADKTWSEVICNRYTGEMIVDPRYFGTSNYCTDAPNGMKTGSLSTKEHFLWDVKTHELYGAGYKHIAKGIPVGYYDGDIPHPVILHEPQGGPKAIYMSKENDPKYKLQQAKPTTSTTTNVPTTPNNNKPQQQLSPTTQASISTTTAGGGIVIPGAAVGGGGTTGQGQTLQVQNLKVETLHVHTLHVHTLQCHNLQCENLQCTNLEYDHKTTTAAAAAAAAENKNDNKQQQKTKTIKKDHPNTTTTKLPKGWIGITDDESGDMYYYNEITGESTWDRPTTTT